MNEYGKDAVYVVVSVGVFAGLFFLVWLIIPIFLMIRLEKMDNSLKKMDSTLKDISASLRTVDFHSSRNADNTAKLADFFEGRKIEVNRST